MPEHLEDVSRETLDALQIYADLLVKWNPKINLVSASTIDGLWDRHFIDSLQLMPLMANYQGRCFDLGTGGGFPGLVCAIAAKNQGLDLRFTFVESDRRKAAFLKTVARETAIDCDVVAGRIEQLAPTKVSVITARALASIEKLLELSTHIRGPETACLFLKGAKAEQELEEAQRNWSFTAVRHASQTDPSGVILELKDVKRA